MEFVTQGFLDVPVVDFGLVDVNRIYVLA